jgi:copper(I)-binding protein
MIESITPMNDLRSSAFHPRSSAFPRFLVAAALATASLAAQAEVTAKDAWVRGTVPAQKSTGAFVTLTSTEDAKLVAAASPAAKQVEIHMSMRSGDVMHMHAVDAVELPAGQAVELKPGGYHVMLMGLTRPIKVGDKVPLVFTVQDRRGKRSTVEVQAAVRPLGSR